MKRITLLGATFAAMAAATLMSAPAFAGPTYTFSTSTGSQPSNAGTITLTQGDTANPSACTAADCVTIDLTFSSGIYGVMNNQVPFAFELNSAGLAGTLGILWINPTGGSYVDSKGVTDQFSLNTGTVSQSGFGTFNVSLSDTAGNGSTHAYYSELTFVLTSTAALDTNDFIQNGNTPGVYFTADLTNGSSTGPQAWESTTRRVPEPATILLFGSVLAGLGLLRRRRSKTA